MDNKTTMIAAVVVVAIVIVAGCAVFFLNNNNNNNKSDDNSVIASELQIRGNANDDYTIDSKDMAIVKDVMDGKKALKDYPLADANGDGKVDSTDVTLVQNLIDRKSGSDVYVICLDRTGNTTTVKTTYPLRNVVTYGTNMQMPALYANGGQYVAGYFNKQYTTAEKSLGDAEDLGGSTREISDTAWANFAALAGKQAGLGEPVGAMLVDYSGIKAITEARMKDLNDAGIPAIIWSSADPKAEITTVLTLGFLFGGDCEKIGVSYAKESWSVLKQIENKVGGLADKDKVSYISITMWYYICQNDSTFNTTGQLAGGIPYYKVNSDFATKYAGTSSTAMSSVEALANYKDVGAVISNRSMDWGLDEETVKSTIVTTWEAKKGGHPTYEYFNGLTDKLYCVNNLLPGVVRVAYAAQAMYPTQFTQAWADQILKDFINMGTEPLKGQSLDTIVAYIDLDIYTKAKA